MHTKSKRHKQNGSKLVIDEMNKVNVKLIKARELLLSEDIDPIDYRTIKTECENKLTGLEAKCLKSLRL